MICSTPLPHSLNPLRGRTPHLPLSLAIHVRAGGGQVLRGTKRSQPYDPPISTAQIWYLLPSRMVTRHINFGSTNFKCTNFRCIIFIYVNLMYINLLKKGK